MEREKKKKCMPTANNIQRAPSQYLVHIDSPVGRRRLVRSGHVEFLNQITALFIEDVEKTFQNLKMESRCQKATATSPSCP